MLELLSSTDIFELIGVISTLSFIIIAFSDFIVHSINIVVERFLVPSPKFWVQRLVFIWWTLKDIYEEFRKFMDKLSAYSRPRNVEDKKKG